MHDSAGLARTASEATRLAVLEVHTENDTLAEAAEAFVLALVVSSLQQGDPLAAKEELPTLAARDEETGLRTEHTRETVVEGSMQGTRHEMKREDSGKVPHGASDDNSSRHWNFAGLDEKSLEAGADVAATMQSERTEQEVRRVQEAELAGM